MKKLYTILLFLLLYSSALANPAAMMTANQAASGASDCASGTWELAYNGDHSTGATYVCYESASQTSEVATANTADSVSTSYVQFDALNENLEFTLTGDISANIDEQGSLFFSWRAVDGGDTTFDSGVIIELTFNATQVIYCTQNATNSRILCYHNGGGSGSSVVKTGLSYNTDYRVGYTWNAATNNHALKIVTSGAADLDGALDDDDPETVDGFNDGSPQDPTKLSLGENVTGVASAGDDDRRVWDVYLTTDHKGKDPGSL